MKKALPLLSQQFPSVRQPAPAKKPQRPLQLRQKQLPQLLNSSEAETEEDYTSGVITAIDGDILTVKDDYDDQERKYDISKAEVTKDFPLSEVTG